MKCVFAVAVILQILATMPYVVAAPVTANSKPTIGELIDSSQASDWRTVKQENLLYIALPAGRVIIELNSDFAPESVANIKALAQEKYWDGLAVVRVQDNYVVQWADPNAEKPDSKRPIKKAKSKLPAELDVPLNEGVSFKKLPDTDTYAREVGFSNGFAAARDAKKMWLLHCYGAVGVGRDNAPDSGNGTELYTVIGHAPRHLDRNVTVVGRVLQGMEYFSSLPRGHGKMGFYEKPSMNTSIKSIRLGSDVLEKDRVELEVLRTDSSLFEKMIVARRNRSDEWFHYKAGRIDVCNFPIQARVKTTATK